MPLPLEVLPELEPLRSSGRPGSLSFRKCIVVFLAGLGVRHCPNQIFGVVALLYENMIVVPAFADLLGRLLASRTLIP
jgi:hypothetical protein